MTTKLNVQWKGTQCALFINGQLAIHGPWRAFDEMTQALRRVESGLSPIEYAQAGALCLAKAGTRFRFTVVKFTTLISLAELQGLTRALYAATRSAEAQEDSVRSQQVADGALMLRAGIPFGLSNDPKVKDAIRNEVAHNTTLRRAMPFAQARGVPGAPTVGHISRTSTLALLKRQHDEREKDLYADS